MIAVSVLGCLSSCSKKDSAPTGPAPTAGAVQEIEPNDGTPQNLGTLGTSDITVSGTVNAFDVDKFSIALGATVNLYASVGWQGSSDIDLGVMNQTGIMLSFQDSGAQPERCTLTARPAGVYIIQVTSKTSTATGYTLTIGSR